MDSYERVLGCFYGAAIGDAMGAATETMTPQMILDRYGAYVDQLLAPGDGTFSAGCPAGFVTDDFSLAYFTALEILKAPDGPICDTTAQTALINWFGHPEYFCFAGPSTSVAIKKILGEPVPQPPVIPACDNSRASNGSAMKIFPAGLKNPGRPEHAVTDAITLCKPTHDNAASLSAAFRRYLTQASTARAKAPDTESPSPLPVWKSGWSLPFPSPARVLAGNARCWSSATSSAQV